MRKSDDYAGNQIRLFLGDLKNGTHQVKIKAVERLQNYIKSYQPNISDDNVDYLFTGYLDGNSTTGLLEWCGADSEKHDGQLKRISGPLIGFLRWLVTFPDDSIYSDRFIRLSQEELNKINFPKHISSTENRFNIPGQSRSGSSLDAFELLCVLINEHRNVEDEFEPVDLNFLLRGNKQCQDRFEEWLQKSNVEHINDTLALLKSSGANGPKIERDAKRARCWAEINFKCIPLQEGEDDESAEIDNEPDELPPIPDPLGITGSDLRNIQDLYASGQLHRSALRTRRNTAALLAYDASSGNLTSVKTTTGRDLADDDGDDDDDEDVDRRGSSNEKRTMPSVIPSDKSFSVALFLSLVHGNTTFTDLKEGLEHLKDHLTQQSRRRENLVRTHFGLFVQCSDGLEWLKSYRKGVMKPLDVPKVKSYRRSIVEESPKKGSTAEMSSNDKGMDKLKKAQSTLGIAKAEAKSTLAPILERMKHSREIKSAEKVLKGMSSLLDHPHCMKIALERNELKEVVSIYQRVKAIPSTASLKIVPKIKSAAESVLMELKKHCFGILLSPNPNFPVLMRYAQLLSELDGTSTYLEALRQTFLRQLICFVECLRDAYEKFCVDCVDAYDKGQELNIISKSNHMSSGGENESFVSVVKKFTNNIPTITRRNSRAVRRPSTATTSLKMASRDSFSSEGVFDDSHTDILSEMGYGDDAMSVFDEDNELFADVDHIESMRGGGCSFKDIVDKAQRDGIESFTSNQDYSDILCNIVRKTFAETIMEISSKWFSCLFRLACEIMSQQLSIVKSTAASNNPAKQGPSNLPVSMNNNNVNNKQVRSNISANRLLALSLGIGSSMLQQSTNGLATNFRKFNLPTEIFSAIQELDQYAAVAENSYHSVINHGFNNLSVVVDNSSNRFSDLLSLSIFQNPLKPYFYHNTLAQVYVLFDSMESAMKTATNTLGDNGALQNTPLDSFGNSFQKFPQVDQSINVNNARTNRMVTLTKQFGRELQELEFTAPTSPYYDCMQTLFQLSQEGEVSMGQKLLESLSERVYSMTDVLFNESDGYNNNMDFQARCSIENAVKQMEDILLKGINMLARHVKRHEWVASVVYENIFQKILVSFLERLRRKFMSIEELKSAMFSNEILQSSPNNIRRKRKKSHSSTRASMHQNQLILQSLDEELLNIDCGWERDDGGSVFQSKPSAWMDLLRGCVRFRSVSLPKVLKELSKTFVFDAVNLPGALPSTVGRTMPPIQTLSSAASTNSSILNRLFAFDNAPEPPTSSNGSLSKRADPVKSMDTNNNQNSFSLFDRIVKNLSVDDIFLMDDLNSRIGKQYIFAYVKDVVRLETDTVMKYVQYRLKGIKSILFSSYTLLLHQESRRPPADVYSLINLPNHISRIILAVNEERKLLNQAMFQLSIERGSVLEVLNEESRSAKDQRLFLKNDSDMSKTSGDQKYCSYLFQELCIGILTCYEELIKRLLSNQPLTISAINKTASISDSNIRSIKSETPFRTVHQATEEYEYFKIILRPNFVDAEFLQKQIFTSAEVSVFNKEKSNVRREDLLKVGQLLSTMIQ